MAHELSFKEDGQVEMAYMEGGEIPWHKLGNIWLKSDSREIKLQKCGFDHEIMQEQSFYHNPALNENIEVPNTFVNYRSDTGFPLGTVSGRYSFEGLQPEQIFDRVSQYVGVAGLEIDTAGVLFGGKRIWMQASTNMNGEIVKGDEVTSRLLFATSYDGSIATEFGIVGRRVVCDNTLRVALNDKGKTTIRIPHSTKFDFNKVADELAMLNDKFKHFMIQSQALAAKHMSDTQAKDLLRDILAKPHHSSKEKLEIDKSRVFEDIFALYSGGAKGSDLKALLGTPYQLVNAVTEYVDHHGRQSKSFDHRFNQTMFGAGDTLKSHAMQTAVNQMLVA